MLRRVLLGIVMLLCGATAVAQRWELLAERGMGFCNHAYDPVVQKLFLVTMRNVLYVSDDFGAHTRRIANLPTGRPGSWSFLVAENGYFYLPSTDKGGGYFRSSDEGATWVHLTAPTIARSDSVNIRYVPELDELLTLTHRSSDHGMTWLPIKNDGTRNRSVSSLVFSSNSAVWYGLDQFTKRLVRTTDNGATWTDLDTTGLATVDTPRLTVHPSDDRILFLAGDFVRDRNYLYRSSDAGATWTAVGANRLGMPQLAETEKFIFRDSSTVFLHAHDVRGSWSAVFQSSDAGSTWKEVLPNHHFHALWTRGPELCGWDIDRRILLKRRPDETAWRSGDSIAIPWTGNLVSLDYRHFLALDGMAPLGISTNGGGTWSRAEMQGNVVRYYEPTLRPTGDAPSEYAAPVISTKSIPPALFTGYSRSLDGGWTWVDWNVPSRYRVEKFLAAHPVEEGRVYASVYDTLQKAQRVLTTRNAGASWEATGFPILDYFFNIAPSQPSLMFGWCTVGSGWPFETNWKMPGHFYFSTNAGTTWSDNKQWITRPEQDSVHVASASGSLGKLRTPLSHTYGDDRICLHVNPRDSENLFFFEYYFYDPNGGEGWSKEPCLQTHSSLFGSWSACAWPLLGVVNEHSSTRGVDAMFFSPWGGDTMIVFVDGFIRVSIDHGGTWSTNICGPDTMRNAQVAWLPRPLILGSSKSGVMESSDLGVTWTWRNAGLWTTYVNAVHLDWRGNLYAVSDDGIYRWGQVLDADAEQSSGTANFALLENYPSPVRAATTITFTLPERMHATLRVFNALGAEVATLSDAELQAGAHSMEWNTGTLPAGLYIVQLRAGKQSACRSIVVAR